MPWISRDATNVVEVPDRIVIIGGGVVGCESATWLNALGAQVVLLAREERLMVRTEPFAGDLVAEAMRTAGIDVRLGVDVSLVERGEIRSVEVGHPRGSEVAITVDGERIVADEVLIAAGRVPASDRLGLETVGLTPNGFVDTDDSMAVRGVAGDWLYAVGDITGRALLTHMGKYQARVCGDVIAARASGEATDARRYRATSDHGAVPQVTFTEPEVGSVGLTEADARAAGLSVRAVEYDLGALGGTSLLRDNYRGLAKLVVDTSRDVLVGATFVGPAAGEHVYAATVAVVAEVPLEVLWHAVPSFPTPSEVWLRLLETWRSDDGG
jgi:dihydrolipoamide dehydrogenase